MSEGFGYKGGSGLCRAWGTCMGCRKMPGNSTALCLQAKKVAGLMIDYYFKGLSNPQARGQGGPE